MTDGEYYRILKILIDLVHENPTKEKLHLYNQFKEQLRKEYEKDDT